MIIVLLPFENPCGPFLFVIQQFLILCSNYAGEALFVDDIPSPKDCLYGAFIYGTMPMAHVKGIQFKPTLVSQKVVTIISAMDIPNGGNILVNFFGTERLFADPYTEYAGQPVGLVVSLPSLFSNSQSFLF